MFMVQMVDVLNGDGERRPGVTMWDSGSSMNIVRKSFGKNMKMESTSHHTMISTVGQSSQMKCKVVSF